MLLSGVVTIAAETDQQRIEGTWTVVSRTINGKELAIVGREPWTFRGDRVTEMGNAPQLQANLVHYFELDATASPKHVNFVTKLETDGKTVGVPMQCIYELDGDTLRIGVGYPNKPRPKAFDAEVESPTTVMVLKREAAPDAEENAVEKHREWVDNTGKYKFRAKLVEVDGDFAVLKGADGKVRRVPISRLSERDRSFLRDQAATTERD